MNSTPMQTRTRIIDGLEIRYADCGSTDGPVMLLTSPWPESLLAFRRIWPSLAATGRVVAVDLPGFGHSGGRADLFKPSAMAGFLRRFIEELDAGPVHLVAPDIGTSASLFLAAWHPDAVMSVVTGGGAAACPLKVSGVLADIIAAPGVDALEGQDVRATIGATVEPDASRADEPEVWEDYVTAYENGRFAQSARYMRSYPGKLAALRDLLPGVKVPVRVVAGVRDPLVPLSNVFYLAGLIPRSHLVILDAGHFAWEEAPGQYASAVADWVTRIEQHARNRVA